MRTLLAVFIAGLLIAADSPKDDAGKKDLEKFQGTWSAVELEQNGEKLPAEQAQQMTVTFKGNKVTVKRGDRTEPEETIKLDASKSPKEIDVTPESRGIYEFSGDTLKIRFTRKSGADRPTKFTGATKEGEAQILLKRQKG